MNSKQLKNISLALASASLLAACNPLNKMAKTAETMKYDAAPNPMEMHADEVTVKVSGKFPADYFNKKAAVTVKPIFMSGGEVVKEFDSKTFVGEDSDVEGTIINFEKGGNFEYELTVPYSSELERGEMWVVISGAYKTKSKELARVKIADGTIITPYMVMSDDRPILGNDEFVRITPSNLNAEIFYTINSSQVRGSELKNEDVMGMMDSIKSWADDSTYVFKSLAIEAYASPDGELAVNDKLADNRAKSAGSAVERQLKRSKIEGADAEGFSTFTGKGEDWNGFKSAMQSSNIEDKDLIVRVLGMYDDVAKREQEIKNMAETYEVLKEDILPSLRRAQIALNVDKVGKSDEEIAQMATTNPEGLTVEELLYAATLTDDMDGKLDVYKSVQSIYPNDWRGHNNVGYILLLQNKVNDAETNFEKAASVMSTPVVNNNLGVVARLNGDRESAAEYYSQAAGAGSDVNYNMAILDIQNGEYESAVTNFGSNNTFNAALAQLLSGDADKATSTIDASEDKNSAEAFYLKAIIAARADNASDVVKNLKTAISKDASLKAKAMKDAEFVNLDFSTL